MMCPGRFPSPTPSREASPVPHSQPESPSPTPQRRTAPRDFTASDTFRKRPRFADSESEPIVSRARERLSIPTRPSSAIGHRAADKRRVSNPLPDTSRSNVQNYGNASLAQVPRQRAVSAQFGPRTSDSPPSSRPFPPSQPTQLTVSESSCLVDIRLREKLQEPLKSDDCGVIYILRNNAQPQQGYKIGLTERPNYFARTDEHRTTCKFEPEVVYRAYDVYCSSRTDQLIRADLT
jgi:hypothetical protein